MSTKTIENKLKGTNIGGKFVGGDDHSQSIVLDKDALVSLHNLKKIEKFGINAQKNIARVAEKILETHDVSLTDQGLDFQALGKKFRNVKCTEDYINNFKGISAYFHEIDQIRANDSVGGGEITIRCIMVLITKLYNHFFPECDNGDLIHKEIFAQIISDDASAEELIATDILIFYTVNECGIFNERK